VWRRGAVDPLIERLFWRKGDRILLALIHNPLRLAQVDVAGETADGLPGGDPEPIRLEFASPVAALRNERTGRDRGDGTTFEDTWVPCEANIYSFALGGWNRG
jgi:hypothetical protein